MNPLIILTAIILVIFLLSKSQAAALPTSIPLNVYNWQSEAEGAGLAFGIPSPRILAIIDVESQGAPDSQGLSGEKGLMQVKQDALTDVNRKYNLGISWADMNDPRKNILVGTAYLAIQRDAFGSLDYGTQAYHVGPGTFSNNNQAGADYLMQVKAAEQLIKIQINPK